MNCPNCHAPVPQDALLCPNCGYHVATAYQRGQVNSIISDRPGVVRRSFRSGLFVVLAILMSIISVVSLVQMVLTIEDCVSVYEDAMEVMQLTGSQPELIAGLIVVSILAIISILTFSLALTSAISSWQNICSKQGLQVNHLSSMGAYLGLQRVWAVIGAVLMIFSVALVTICGLLLGDFISDSGEEIAAYMQEFGVDATEWLSRFEKFMEDGMATFALIMLVVDVLVIWIFVAHARVFGKSLTSIKRLIGVLDPNSYKGKEWVLTRGTPMFGPCFFGFFYVVFGLILLYYMLDVLGAVISIVLGIYLIVFAAYVSSVRKQLVAHENVLYSAQQKLATVESNTAMEIRNIRIAQEHQQRQDAERRRQEEIQRHADEEEQRRMIRQAQEEQQQMMQQLMLSMTAINIPNKNAAETEEVAAPLNQQPETEVEENTEDTYEAPAVEETVYDDADTETVYEEPAAEELAAQEPEVLEQTEAEEGSEEVEEAEAFEASEDAETSEEAEPAEQEEAEL